MKNAKTKMRLLNLLVILSIFGNTLAQDSESSQKMKMDSLIGQYMETFRISGLSIGLVKDGTSYISKGYGYTSVEMKYPSTSRTLFHTASITKVFTATAIMQLVEKKQINLTDKLIDHLPDFQMKDERYKDITIEQLLTHSSGLPWEHAFKNSTDDATSLERFVLDLKNEKLKFSPGEKFDGSTYSNVAYSILGLIIERKTGLSYAESIQKYVFEPTGMSHSTFTPENIALDIKALPQILSGSSKEIKRFNMYGEVKDENPVLKYPDNPIVIRDTYGRNNEHDPNDGLVTSVEDMNKWMVQLLEISNDSLELMNGVLSHSTLKDMWSLKKNIEGFKTSLGICWWRYPDENFGNSVSHVGREPGFCSTLMLFPEQNFGITILCNGMYADQLVWNKLPYEIMEIFGLKKTATNTK